jgi:polysaccharide biosynthesis transport protein
MDGRHTGVQQSRLTLDDVYYVLFKQKWKIISCAAAGLLVALTFLVVRKPLYESEAKLIIRYVVDSKSPTPTLDNSRVISPYEEGQTVINSEMEILTSLDLAEQVVDAVGAKRILAKAAGGTNRIAAANLIRQGLIVEAATKSKVIRVVFQHPDAAIVQPVLTALIDGYFRKHAEIHQAVGVAYDLLRQETDQLRSQLAQTEKELRQARGKAGVLSLGDGQKDYSDQIAKIRQRIFDAEDELAERRTILKEITPLTSVTSKSSKAGLVVAWTPVDEYKSLTTRIDQLWKKHQELMTQFTEENTLVKGLRGQIAEAEGAKKKLEDRYPALAWLDTAPPKSGDQRVALTADVSAQKALVKTIQSKIKVFNAQLERVHKEIVRLDEMEPVILELQRKKQLEESNYLYMSASLEQARIDEEFGRGKLSNINRIQDPSPPFRPPQDSRKAVVIVAGCILGGLAWAFLVELYLDRSVKRPIEVQTKLHLPLFISIPDVNGNGHRHLASGEKHQPLALKAAGSEASSAAGNGKAEASSSLESRAARHKQTLLPFYEALRDRLVMYFEIRSLTRKPKLIAVTSSNKGAGVTTTAAGLAACLSETGDGNVLLVNMNLKQGWAQHFYKGRVAVGLEEALNKKDDAMVQEKLYVVTEAEGSNRDKLRQFLPKRFTNLVPKLKASDYDYIIFDMPPISQTSVTPRLAGFMDMVLLVIESEKTDRQIVQQTCALLDESKANVCAVLNRTHTYVPQRLHQEYLSDS